MKTMKCAHEFSVGAMPPRRAFFITGSGTCVGKTFAAGYIARTLVAAGHEVAYMKAVQTGLSEAEPDTKTVQRICPETIELPDELACPYSFGATASPHFAAKCENRKIHPAKIVRAFDKIRLRHPKAVILVEGAGGIMVPIIRTYMMIDLARDLDIPAVIVASPLLGTINHSLLTCQALRSRKIPVAGIAFSMLDSALDERTRDSILTIREISRIRNCGMIPRIVCPPSA